MTISELKIPERGKPYRRLDAQSYTELALDMEWLGKRFEASSEDAVERVTAHRLAVIAYAVERMVAIEAAKEARAGSVGGEQ